MDFYTPIPMQSVPIPKFKSNSHSVISVPKDAQQNSSVQMQTIDGRATGKQFSED